MSIYRHIKNNKTEEELVITNYLINEVPYNKHDMSSQL